MNTRNALSLVAVFALIGVANAAYLTFTSLAGISPLCTLTSGCDIVSASPYSRVFGVPLSLFGVFFYTLVFGFGLWGRVSGASVRLFLLPLTALGFLLSLYFLYLQALVIGAYCQWCLLSLGTATILFALSLFLFKAEPRVVTPDNVAEVTDKEQRS